MRSALAVNPRELIPSRCDWHLSNWAQWMLGYEVGIGYDHASAVVTGYGSSSFDDLCMKMDRQHAKVINAIVEGLTQMQQMAIHNVYIADVWKPNRPGVSMAEVFIEAAGEVWRIAQKRGLE